MHNIILLSFRPYLAVWHRYLNYYDVNCMANEKALMYEPGTNFIHQVNIKILNTFKYYTHASRMSKLFYGKKKSKREQDLNLRPLTTSP